MYSVLLPEVTTIGNRHYRKNCNVLKSSISEPLPVGQLEEPQRDIPAISLIESGNLSAPEWNVPICEGGAGFTCTLPIPAIFHRFIVGPQKSVLRRLEQECNCRLQLPRTPNTHSVVVESRSQLGVAAACRRLKWIITEARTHCSPTHFISLPVASTSVRSAFRRFRDEILRKAAQCSSKAYDGIDYSIFANEHSLHFTLVALVLADSNEIETACELLKGFSESPENRHLFAGGPLKLDIKGLDSMNDDPSAAHVLYGTVIENSEWERLQKIANGIAELFLKSDLACDRSNHSGGAVKLHVTLLNSRFRAERDENVGDVSGKSSAMARVPFCIEGILRDFSNLCLAKGEAFSSIHLCDRFESDPQTGFYKCLYNIPLIS